MVYWNLDLAYCRYVGAYPIYMPICICLHTVRSGSGGRKGLRHAGLGPSLAAFSLGPAATTHTEYQSCIMVESKEMNGPRSLVGAS